MNKNVIIENDLIIIDEDSKYFYIKDKENFKYKISKKSNKLTLQKYSVFNPYTLDNINTFIKNNDINLQLLSTEFKGTHEPLLFIDKNGHKFYRDWHNMQMRKSYLCAQCSLIRKANKRRHSQQEVEAEFREKGYVLLDNYVDNNLSMKCLNEEGYLGKISRGNLLFGKTIDVFSKLNPYAIDNINKFLKDNLIETQILSKEFGGCEENLQWKCSCGNVFYRSWQEFKYRNRYVCNQCNMRMSKNEKIIKEFLDINNIEYIEQYKFNDCGDVNCYPFDFYLPLYNLCIEVQGEQHYKYIRFGARSKEDSINRFYKQRERDKIKREYCINNKINFLAISYIDIKNNNYKKILSYKLNINV